LFPMTAKAFTQAWKKVVKRAGIKDLHFHDLRRTANVRFHYAGLTLEERNVMLRHADRSTNAVYIGREHLLNEIQKKLDKAEELNAERTGKQSLGQFFFQPHPGECFVADSDGIAD
jgi:integrase